MKQTLYPKTKRIGTNNTIITEKLDGSNIGFFKYDDKLFIAQRNNIFSYESVKNKETDNRILYKGLLPWLEEHAEELTQKLQPTACIFGEWIGMGKLQYDFEDKLFMFAKANVKFENDKFEVRNIVYNHEYFIYPFMGYEIPDFIKIVPVVEFSKEISIDALNDTYKKYTELVNRNVEGFVIFNNGAIQKYVRMKNGKIEPHRSK